MKTQLTPKQQRFVGEYLIDLNASAAAIRAGYSAKAANQTGPRMLVNAGVAEAVKLGKAEHLARTELTADRVLAELGRIAFSNITNLFDEKGNFRPIHTLTAEQAAAIGAFEVIKKNAEAGDGRIDVIHKIRMLDKVRALEILAKYFGLLTERVEHGGNIVIRWQDSSD
jgi:phage terminase small subunit